MNVYSMKRAESLQDDIPDVQPAFERKHFKQREHGVSNVVKIEAIWVGPDPRHVETRRPFSWRWFEVHFRHKDLAVVHA